MKVHTLLINLLLVDEVNNDKDDDQKCKTISGLHVNQECQFPFIFRGTVYDTCITGSKRIEPWCPIELDNNGSYIKGKWGYCDQSHCPLAQSPDLVLGNRGFQNGEYLS